MTETKGPLESGEALAALTKYADDMRIHDFRNYLDALGATCPPGPPPTLRQRLSWWIQDRRRQFADWLRDVADRIS